MIIMMCSYIQSNTGTCTVTSVQASRSWQSYYQLGFGITVVGFLKLHVCPDTVEPSLCLTHCELAIIERQGNVWCQCRERSHCCKVVWEAGHVLVVASGNQVWQHILHLRQSCRGMTWWRPGSQPCCPCAWHSHGQGLSHAQRGMMDNLSIHGWRLPSSSLHRGLQRSRVGGQQCFPPHRSS